MASSSRCSVTSASSTTDLDNDKKMKKRAKKEKKKQYLNGDVEKLQIAATKEHETTRKRSKKEKKETRKKKRRREEHDEENDENGEEVPSKIEEECENTDASSDKEHLREKKKKKKDKNRKRKARDGERERRKEEGAPESSPKENQNESENQRSHDKAAEAKAKGSTDNADAEKNGVTLLLFYQYVDPVWTLPQFRDALRRVRASGTDLGLTGRMRVAREGLNCTLTGAHDDVREWCERLRGSTFGDDRDRHPFRNTDFKLTDGLPRGQAFPKLNCFEVKELVNYGLEDEGEWRPEETGMHLSPEEYHAKMTEEDTVIIDVRNHYESAIGHFDPPATTTTTSSTDTTTNNTKLIDPMMRKSTEFPVWLDKPETKELLRNKQVLMYCTGGVRCERASSLLRRKMETESDTRDLNIKGVYQLQGGVDKYFKQFPDGGYWKGKNYTFDKRFAHKPASVQNNFNEKKAKNDDNDKSNVLGKCEACAQPWDAYRGKRRCPTCGVPSLVCRDCFEKGLANDRNVRCDLCVKENVTSKSQIRKRESEDTEAYRARRDRKRSTASASNGATSSLSSSSSPSPNSDNVTRLFVGNMCRKTMDEDMLCKTLGDVDNDAAVTHVQWLTDRKTGLFYGSAFVEMDSPRSAAIAVSKNGTVVLGRSIRVRYQKADPKDVWPPPGCAIARS